MSAAAESNGAVNGTAVLERVKQVWAEADAAGQKRPGRGRLAALLDVKEHQVQKALTELKQQGPSADTSDEAPVEPVISATPSAPQPYTGGKPPRPWPLAIIGLAAAVAVWSGWVGLGEMAGFGPVNLLPGIGRGFTINSAVVLPISVEAYASYALRVWLSTSYHGADTIRFAKVSTVTSLVVGGAAQVVYHLLAAAGFTVAPWPVTMLVALVPVLVLGLAAALAKLVANDRQAGGDR